MRRLQTDVLVIGGGATGTGVLRDLAMRGFKCILVERRDLAYGTTGRFHGLLHSGGRYVVKDPQAARECYEENQILRRILPQCIEDTGGYFVQTPQDDPAYIPRFVQGCHAASIPIEPVPIHKMLKKEPFLNPEIQQCFFLPDASADSFLAADLNAECARQHNGEVMTYHPVSRLLIAGEGSGSRAVMGAVCHDLIKDEDVQIDASMIVNASGAWAGKIAQMAGINLVMVAGKGTLLALNHRVVNTIISRCRPPSDGDALVPTHTVTVMGTTDVKVTDPDYYAIEPWEIRLMLDEGEKIIPLFKQLRILRAWAGVRPLVQGADAEADRDISRAFVLVDHAHRDGIDGIVTITSGKWTTYRKMAQVTADKVCEKLKVDRPCRTHLEALPRQKNTSTHHYLGHRLENIEKEISYGQLICECELATVAEIERSIDQSGAKTLDDIRRDTRLGMGPCQGAFCAFRAAGMLHSMKRSPVEHTNTSLRDFLQERWKGNLPILWGQQLRQARFNEFLYVNVLNAPALPGPHSSRLAADEYSAHFDASQPNQPSDHFLAIKSDGIHPSSHQDIIVIGAGLAGLIAGWRASSHGLKAAIITKGWGADYWGTGCIDIFGYRPPEYEKSIVSPVTFLETFIRSNPRHPYALVGLPSIQKAVQDFLSLCDDSGYPYRGSLEANILLPTSLGSLRPTCLTPQTMVAGDASQKSPMLIVGFDQFLDFYPTLVADNLSAQGVIARGISLDVKSLHNRKFLSGMVLARLFDHPEFRQEVIGALITKLGNEARIGFPAVLGIHHSKEVLSHLESSLGIPVFEVAGLPPSIPGIRLHNLLVSAIERSHGALSNGMDVTGFAINDRSVDSVWSEAAARQKSHCAKAFVLATGGILGGGFTTNIGYAQESIFDLPVSYPIPPAPWFKNEFLSGQPHPIFGSGISIDSDFQPVSSNNQVIYQNLFAAGNILGNCDPVRERSHEGLSLATGYHVGELLSKRYLG